MCIDFVTQAEVDIYNRSPSEYMMMINMAFKGEYYPTNLVTDNVTGIYSYAN